MRGKILRPSRDLSCPNAYVQMLGGEFSPWSFNEEQAPLNKGCWRTKVFAADENTPLDLEIGTGNGYHFAHRAIRHPERLLVGIELKYKPLIQSIRRAVKGGARNARIMRYDASALVDLFAPGELCDVFIHFPDPWPRRSQWKHRLITDQFLRELYLLQRPGHIVEFKTDSRDYFLWTVERFLNSSYKVEYITSDLHHSERAAQNFMTHFERLFLRQGLPIHQVTAVRA